MVWCRVYTVNDYFDGPRSGIADYQGRPHAYESQFNDSQDSYGDIFLVMPISDELFRLAMEDWNIFLRWEAAFRQGNATQDSHPALPKENARHLQLKLLIGNQLAVVPEKSKRVSAVFRHQSADGRDTEVTWLDSPVV